MSKLHVRTLYEIASCLGARAEQVPESLHIVTQILVPHSFKQLDSDMPVVKPYDQTMLLLVQGGPKTRTRTRGLTFGDLKRTSTAPGPKSVREGGCIHIGEKVPHVECTTCIEEEKYGRLNGGPLHAHNAPKLAPRSPWELAVELVEGDMPGTGVAHEVVGHEGGEGESVHRGWRESEFFHVFGRVPERP